MPVLGQRCLFWLFIPFLIAQDWLVKRFDEFPLLANHLLRKAIYVAPLNDSIIRLKVDTGSQDLMLEPWRRLYLSSFLLHLTSRQVWKFDAVVKTLDCIACH